VAAREEEKKQPAAFWEINSAEVDQLVDELKKEKTELAAREQQLNELATRLQAERSEINQATQQVYQLQKEFDQNVVRVREEEAANLKKMAKIYAAMSPEGAAGILKNLEDEQVVKFLVFMKESETAPILEAWAKLGEADSKRAALISNKLRASTYRNLASKTPAS
jgi:flagellar motility protein MotE (MotC chaperone)